MPTSDETARDRLRRRWRDLGDRLADLHDLKTVDGDPADIEAGIRNEQHAIEYLLGLKEFEDCEGPDD